MKVFLIVIKMKKIVKRNVQSLMKKVKMGFLYQMVISLKMRYRLGLFAITMFCIS